jgi:hypothetical protein
MRCCLLSPLERRGPWTRPEYGTGSWPLALGADLFPYGADDLAPLERYDVLLLVVAMGLYDRIGEVLDRFAHKTRVLMLTCDAMFLDPQGFFPGFRTPLGALLDRADLAASETEETAFFQAMSDTPVVHLPLPLPLAALRAVARTARAEGPPWDVEGAAAVGARTARAEGPPGRRPRVWLGAAFRATKNGLATALAFQRLRERFPEGGAPQAIVFADEPEAEGRAYSAWGIEGVSVLPTCAQPDLWRRAARCALALHLDHRRTIGRFSGDCAALGVPCVSTAGATMQRACFPDLTVEPWDVEGAAAVGAGLLRDRALAGGVTAKAARAVAAFDLEPMARRFRQALKTV